MTTVYLTVSRDRDHRLEVECEVLSRPLPAKLTGHPDTWAPAEGGELNWVRVYLIRGDKRRRLPRRTEDELLDDESFNEKLWEELT